MSSFLLAGRTNSVQIAKVRAQRNLRAAPHTLPWLGGRETGKLQQLFNIITLFYNSFLFPCASHAHLLFSLLVASLYCWTRREVEGSAVHLTDRIYVFILLFSRCNFMLFLLSLVFVRLSGGVGVSLARS